MTAVEMISNRVPVLTRADTCMQALNWMEVFRVSHLPVAEDGMYYGLLGDELIYSHGELNGLVGHLTIPAEGTFVYEDFHIYNVIDLASSGLLSVVPVLDRKNSFKGTIVLPDVLHQAGRLLGVGKPGGIIILEVSSADYSLAEAAQIVEYNEAKILSCFATYTEDSTRVELTLKVNTQNITPLLDSFIRYDYTVRNSFVTGEEEEDILKQRYGLLMKYLSI